MTEINGFKFDISKEGAILRSYTGDELDIVIPDTVDGEPVIKIGNDVFLKSKIKSVVIPQTVTDIGAKVFDGCSKLAAIHLPSGIVRISYRCFAQCKSLTEVTIPDKVKLIEWEAFSGCSNLTTINFGTGLKGTYSNIFAKCTSLTKMELPNGLEDIGKSAFLGCKNLSEVSIPASVNMIKDKAFAKCENLEIVNFAPRPEGMEGWLTTQTSCFAYTEKMCQNLLSRGKSMHDRVVSGFNKADEEKYRLDQIKVFEMLEQEEKDVFLEEWNKKISASSKKGKNKLRNFVFLKSTAKEMNTYFGVGCNLELAELDEYLEYSIASGNTAETAVLLEYKNKTFSSEFLEEVETRKEMVEIGIENPTLKELREKWTVKVSKDFITIIGYKGANNVEVVPSAIDTGKPILTMGISESTAFGHAYEKLSEIVLSEGIEAINNETFCQIPLCKITLPSTIKTIGDLAFHRTSLTEVIIPDGVCVLEKATFCDCKELTKVVLPDTITRIKRTAFSRCTALEQIVLPKNLEVMDEYVFSRCENLKRVILQSDKVKIDETAFENCKNLQFVGVEGGENIIDRFNYKPK